MIDPFRRQAINDAVRTRVMPQELTKEKPMSIAAASVAAIPGRLLGRDIPTLEALYEAAGGFQLHARLGAAQKADPVERAPT